MIPMSPEWMKSITINVVVISLQGGFRILISQENLEFQNSTDCLIIAEYERMISKLVFNEG